MRPFHFLVASAILGLGLAGTAYAADPRVPTTGSAQGEIIPNALPGGGTPHTGSPEGHLIAPSGIVPQTGQAQTVEPYNSLPGLGTSFGEAQPHTDVTSPPGVVPQTGSAQGPQSPGSL